MELDFVGSGSVHTGTKITIFVRHGDVTVMGAMFPGQTLEQSAKTIIEAATGAKMPGVEVKLSRAWRDTRGLIDVVCLEFKTQEIGHDGKE